jgi:alpha-ketoglutarate-dependent taurine dioxygenase
MNLEKAKNSSHFDLSNNVAYSAWRDRKLSNYPASAKNLLVNINDFNLLSELELKQIHLCLDKFNMVIYSLNNPVHLSTQALCQFASQFGLVNIDGNLCSDEQNVSKVTVNQEGRNKAYIPYTNKPISWHTDGYYNSLDKTVRGFVLHCLQSASSGGENNLMDPEILYIMLRDENPDYILALMENDVLTIPENIEDGVKIREQQSGPVFSIDNFSSKLHLRYTARTRSIAWKESDIVQQAVSMIQNILTNKTDYSFNYKLKAGQGLLCNNVLHNRTAFDDDINTKRELLRARYYDRIGS